MTRDVIKWRADKYQEGEDSPREATKDQEVAWVHVNDEKTGLHVHIDDKEVYNNSNRELTSKEQIIIEDIKEQTKWDKDR